MNNLIPFPLADEPMILASDNIFNITKVDYEDGSFGINVYFKDNTQDIDLDYESEKNRDQDFLNVCNLIYGKNETENTDKL
jgi:hypothetical protein